MKKQIPIAAGILLILLTAFPACKKTEWKPGIPLDKDKLMIGVVHITDPFSESSGYSYAHQTGINEMARTLGLKDGQLTYKNHIEDTDYLNVESAMRDLIVRGAQIIIATSWGYMDTCEKLAAEFPSVVFAHASGYKHNSTNFTNYFGRIYEACYLSGLVAGSKTQSNKIGFVAAWGTENSEVSGNVNAFALGVEKANPEAKVYLKITNSWYDPMGEAAAARALLAEGCDVIAQHCDTPTPQIEAQRAGAWSIGYNTDMRADAPDAVLTSALWNWGAYYTALVKSVLDGSFSTEPYYGSLKDGVVDLAPLSLNTHWDTQIINILADERQRIESGPFDVFFGAMETNDGRIIGRPGVNLTDDEIRSGINWHYRTIQDL